MRVLDFMSIIEVLTTLPLRIAIRFYRSINPLIDGLVQSNLFSWILSFSTNRWESKKVMNGRRLFKLDMAILSTKSYFWFL